MAPRGQPRVSTKPAADPTDIILTVSDARPHHHQPLNPWLLLQPPVWVTYLWWALLVASVIASMAGDPATVCTVAQPCQPDAVFPMVVALVGIAAVAFWWAPVAALVAGLAYAALSVLFDPSIPGRYVAVAVGAASLGALAILRALRAKQAQFADSAAEADLGARALTVRETRRVRPRGWAAAVAPAIGIAGLLLVAGSLIGYQNQTGAEQAHVDRAQQVQAHVATYADGDSRQVFVVENGPQAGERVPIEVAEELDLGSERVLLLDPQDPSWVRLTSEPQGYTNWFGWATLGGFAAAWSAGHLLSRTRAARQDDPPLLHRVRALGDGRAELTLAGSTQPIATVWLGTGGPSPLAGSGSVLALVRGPVADGSWVSITMKAGPLPVVGPLRATHRWRALGVGTDAVSPRVAATLDRARGAGAALGRILFVAFGCFLLWFALGQIGPTWNAAHGLGAPGSFTVMAEDCSGKGPCHHYGNFASNDGRPSFSDVEVVGDSADVGSSIPALYEGNGETPDTVFAPGWKGFIENGFYVAIGLGFVLEPLGRWLGAFLLRRRPPSGRHSRGGW